MTPERSPLTTPAETHQGRRLGEELHYEWAKGYLPTENPKTDDAEKRFEEKIR